MAVDDVYRLVIQANQANNQYMNTYAVRMKSSPDPAESDVITLANATMNIARAQQLNVVTYTSWTFSQLWGGSIQIVQDECRRTPGLQLAGNFTGTTTGGSLSGDPLPPQCAMVWTMLTGFAGRRRRGRSYIFGLGEAAQVGGSWTTPIMTAIRTELATYLALYGVSGTDPQFQVGVWSERTASGCIPNVGTKGRHNVETPRPENAFMRMTGSTLRPIVYTQRRRTLGIGR